MAERPRLRLLALGPPVVRSGSDVLELPPKLLALLTFLAVESPRGSVRRDRLLATFWPEADEARARNALNQAVHQLRTRLGPEVLESRGQDELVLDGRVESDVERFEACLDAGDAARGLELYRGAFLEGFHVRDATGFERWLDGIRARLRRRAREAALAAADDAERGGRPDAAVGYLRRALEIVPTDERAARRMIRLLLDAGDPAAALRAYRRLVRRLESELGIRPTDETRSLVRETGADPSAPEGVARLPAARRVAAELSERARQLLDGGRAENAAARELLAQAVRVDPTCAPAHARTARAVAHWVDLFGGPWEELGRGTAAAGRALELDPELQEAHVARGAVLESAGRLDASARSFRAALELRPGDPEAGSHLARVIYFAGDFAGALEWMRQRGSGDEEDPRSYHELAMIRHCLGQHDRGDALHERALEARPGDRWAQSTRVYFHIVTGRLDRAVELARGMVDREPDGFRGLVALGDALLARGDLESALRFYERCHALDPDSRNGGTLRATRTALGFTHLRVGDPARGRELLDAAERRTRRALASGSSYGALHYDLASIHAARGETEPALEWLERSCRAGWLQHEFLELDRLFEPLRTESRFRAVGAEMRRVIDQQLEQLR